MKEEEFNTQNRTENNKNNILLKIKKSFRIQIIICVCLCTIIIIGFLISNSLINKSNSHKYTMIEDFNIVNTIEGIYTDNKKLVLDGYALLLGRDSSDISISLFLLNTNTGEEIWSEVIQHVRADVNSYLSSEYNYLYSGFQAILKNKKINKDECYEIFIKLDFNDKESRTVSTNRLLLNGELYSYNPNEFTQPEININSVLMKDIFTNGKLVTYQKDAGMYVYLHDSKLYWIVNENYYLDIAGRNSVIYHLYTSQIGKLPDYRVQHGFDNMDFNFMDFEYNEEIVSPYRVAVRDIPDTYQITYINTGIYNSETDKILWGNPINMNPIFE